MNEIDVLKAKEVPVKKQWTDTDQNFTGKITEFQR